MSTSFARLFVFTLFLTLLAVPQFVCADDEEPPKDPVPFTAVEDIVFGHKDGLALTMDVVTPSVGAKGIGVILVSSGGWRSGKSNVAGEEIKRRSNEHWVQGLLKGGYTLFVVRHGSSPRYIVPEMVEDVRRGVRFVRMSADKFKIDPDHLGITSGSSGGHLSLMVALTADDGNPESKDAVERMSSRVQAVVAWFPPTDLINWGMPDGFKHVNKLKPDLLPSIVGKVTDMQEQLKSVSPIYHVNAEDPPLLLIHGDRDITVPLQQSKILEAKYKEVGLPVQLIVHAKGGHTYWPGIMDDYPAVWNWFDKYLSK